ncbi:protein giant, partial [Pseudomyrmex gracilis]|uniref:protein giant n=1 Tax=Pseudomyrmex gracilis TaxID=219809 RepID=UPI000994C281
THHRNVGYAGKRAKICIHERRRCVFDEQVIAAGNTNKTLTPSPVEADSTKAVNEVIYSNSHVNLPSFVVSSPHTTMVTTLRTPILPDNEVIMRFPVAATAMSYAETSLPLPSNEAMRQASLAIPMTLPTSPPSVEMPTSANTHRKLPRPFKAYPLHKTSFPYPTYSTLDYDSNRNYEKFRASMMERVKKIQDGPNPKMRRANKNNSAASTCAEKTTDGKDSTYFEKRRKNNEAAKRSRDARRAKEDELAIRVAFLEQENTLLKHKLEQYMHYSSL